MTRTALLSLLVAGAVAVPGMAAPQQPTIQHAKLEHRAVTALDRDIATLTAAATDPTWIAWRVPVVDGDHNSCCFSSWDNNGDRGWSVGCGLEPQTATIDGTPSPRLQFPAQSSPVKLEGGTGIVVLVRLVDRHIERLRTLSDDCPMDAGDRAVYWLDGVPGDASVRYLRTLVIHTDATNDPRRTIADRALGAIALHRDAGADDALLSVAHMTEDAHLRGQALVNLGHRGGPKAIAELQAVLDKDTNADIRRSALSGILQLPNGDGIPMLIQLAKTSKDPVMRKDAMSRLSGSKDPRAVAFFEEVIKRG